MQGIEFLATADSLSQGPSEGDWRSAVSRAYYAVFIAGLDAAQPTRPKTPIRILLFLLLLILFQILLFILLLLSP
jgi:hypothetical protein